MITEITNAEAIERVQRSYYSLQAPCQCCDQKAHIDTLIRLDPDDGCVEEEVCPSCADWLGLPVCGRCGSDLEEAGDYCVPCAEDDWSPETIGQLRAEARGFRV